MMDTSHSHYYDDDGSAVGCVDDKGKFRESLVSVRLNGDFQMVAPDMVKHTV